MPETEVHAYRKLDDVVLELELVRPDKTEPAAPVVLFFHGGAWRIGSRQQFLPQCAQLARRGAFGISASYRLVSEENGLTPRACVEDGEAALTWLREHAADLGLDAGRIALAGGSAGGQVAAAVAGLQPVSGLVLFNPALAPDGSADLKFLGDLGRYPLEPPYAPALVLHGRADVTVPIDHSRRFRDRLTDMGVRCELVEYDEMPHAFFNHPEPEGRYAATLAEAERFLESLGLLPSPA